LRQQAQQAVGCGEPLLQSRDDDERRFQVSAAERGGVCDGKVR
jgi:hypothetical protein